MQFLILLKVKMNACVNRFYEVQNGKSIIDTK
nr:MAG TPA: hypothetical protein [Caudoviricetes sp.]DAG49377.1 MAG TPA: hypothetical protein [Caudoviricetes sp.]